MDAHRRLNEEEADKALRELFAASGRVQAPARINARILQQIALVSRPIAPEPELLPKWVWIAAAMAFCGVAAFLLANSAANTGPGYLNQLFQNVPEFSLGNLLTSPWLLLMTLAIGGLMALDALLVRGRIRISLR